MTISQQMNKKCIKSSKCVCHYYNFMSFSFNTTKLNLCHKIPSSVFIYSEKCTKEENQGIFQHPFWTLRSAVLFYFRDGKLRSQVTDPFGS